MGVGTGLAVGGRGVGRFAVRRVGLGRFGVIGRGILGAVLVSSSIESVANLNETFDDSANGADAKLDLLARTVLEVVRGLW